MPEHRHIGVGLGSVLSQGGEDGREQVLGFASRTLTQPEMNYCVKRSVLLAVVFRVWKYQAYSAGAHFTIWTDHSALPWLVETKDNEGQMAQWIQM